jgi:hypothetical protein
MFTYLCVGNLCQLLWLAFFWLPVTKMALQINILLSYFIFTFLRDYIWLQTLTQCYPFRMHSNVTLNTDIALTAK